MPLEVREIDSVVARAAPIIKVTEKFFEYIYDDGIGVPTIGWGVALAVTNTDGDYEVQQPVVLDSPRKRLSLLPITQ